MGHAHHLFLAAASVALGSGPCKAAGAAADTTQAQVAYPASYYAGLAPQTALDMIRQTPGFSLQEGADRRGFSGARGNVLIDGERPVAKSQTLSDILQRIPARQVVRIELLRGGEVPSDGSGFAVLANVVRTQSAGQGVWSIGTEYAGRAPVPNGWASWSGRIGKTDYSVGANGYSLSRDLPGERRTSNTEGELLSVRKERSPRSFYEIALNGEAERPMLGGSVKLTGQAYESRYHERSSFRSYDAGGRFTDSEVDPYTELNRNLEAGFEHRLQLGRWDLSLSGLVTRKRFRSDVESIGSDAKDRVTFDFAQDLERHSGESILRAAISGNPAKDHHIEAGIEGAFNTLRQQLDLTLDLGGGPFPIPIPNSNLEVSEHRAEAYVTDSWSLGSGWSVETRVSAEASKLAFEGDSDRSVSLAYFKPSIQIGRRFGGRNEVRLRFYRDVGQLDFTDFVSSASLSDDVIHGGNPELRPETSWRLEAVADFRFGSSGALNVKLFHHWIDNVVDLVPVGPADGRIDAPGNIGRGTVAGLEASLRLPLTAILPAASLTADWSFKHARVRDPLTGRKRRISDLAETALKTEFRQDIAKWKLAWGITYTHKPELVFFRVVEVERKRESPSLDIWAERTVFTKYRLRATILSILDQTETSDRAFFAPDRTSAIVRAERRRRHPGSWLLLTLSGAF